MVLEDREVEAIVRVQIEVHGRADVNALCVAWSRIIEAIFGQFPNTLEWRVRKYFVQPLVQLWREVLPYTLVASDIEHQFPGREVEVLRARYEKILGIVRLMRAVLPMLVRREDDTKSLCVLEDAEAFCTEALTEMAKILAQGPIMCTGEGFRTVVWWLNALLTIAMGHDMAGSFRQSYDAAMQTLNQFVLMESVSATPAN